MEWATNRDKYFCLEGVGRCVGGGGGLVHHLITLENFYCTTNKVPCETGMMGNIVVYDFPGSASCCIFSWAK